MNGIAKHGVEPIDFELWCLAASTIKGCGKCVDSHEKVLRQKGATEELVIAGVRITSVIHAIGTVVDTEAAIAG
jgi:alkyl hydroperoxide reductase subunit D